MDVEPPEYIEFRELADAFRRKGIKTLQPAIKFLRSTALRRGPERYARILPQLEALAANANDLKPLGDETAAEHLSDLLYEAGRGNQPDMRALLLRWLWHHHPEELLSLAASLEVPLPGTLARIIQPNDDPPAIGDDEQDDEDEPDPLDPVAERAVQEILRKATKRDIEAFTLLVLLKEDCTISMMNELLLGERLASFDDLVLPVRRWIDIERNNGGEEIAYLSDRSFTGPFRRALSQKASERHIRLAKQLCVQNDNTIFYALRFLPWHLMEIGMIEEAVMLVAKSSFRGERGNAFPEHENLRLHGQDVACIYLAIAVYRGKLGPDELKHIKMVLDADTKRRYMLERKIIKPLGRDGYKIAKNYLEEGIVYQERRDAAIQEGGAAMILFEPDKAAYEMLGDDRRGLIMLFGFNGWTSDDYDLDYDDK